MPVKTATRAKSTALPAKLGRLQSVIDTPFGSLALTERVRKPGRQPKHATEPGNNMQNDIQFMMMGRTFLLGTLGLLAGLMQDQNRGATHTGEQPKRRRRRRRRAKT